MLLTVWILHTFNKKVFWFISVHYSDIIFLQSSVDAITETYSYIVL